MGVIDRLLCCLREPKQEDLTNRVSQSYRHSGQRSSTGSDNIGLKPGTSDELAESMSVTPTRVHPASLCDVTLSEAQKGSDSMSETSRDSACSNRRGSTDGGHSRTVNVVRPRMSGSPRPLQRISLPEDIETQYDMDKYNQMMSRTHTDMTIAYNREYTRFNYEKRETSNSRVYDRFDNQSSESTSTRVASGYGQRPGSSREAESGTKVYGLLQASCKGDLNGLQKLCHEGVDMGAADYDGRRALHLAAAEGHLNCVKFLLEKCNVPHSPRDRWYHTPLDEAKTFNRAEVIKYLDELITTEEEREKGAKTFLLLNSACTGDIRTLKRLYQEGVDMKLADYDGRTCLHLASAEGHMDCARFLLEQCEVPHSPKDRWFRTPLDEAQASTHTKCAEYLADYIQQYEAKKEGASVFAILNSACKGDTRTLEKLARDGEDMTATDYDGRTALHLAAAEGHIDVVTFLLEKCKVEANPKDRWQHTPMDEARNAKNDNIVRYLERFIGNKTKMATDTKSKK